jgi:hypothetical protein
MLHKLRSGHLTGTKSPFALLIFAVILAVILFGYVYPHLNIYNTSYFTPMFENNRKRGGVGNFASSITNKSLVVFFIYNISNHSLSYHIFTMVSQSKSHNNNSCFKGNCLSRYRAWSSRVLLLLTIHWGKVSDTTTCNKSVELNNLVTTCQQAGNKQCEHILLTSCWNSIATSLLQVCYNLFVFTCVPAVP